MDNYPAGRFGVGPLFDGKSGGVAPQDDAFYDGLLAELESGGGRGSAIDPLVLQDSKAPASPTLFASNFQAVTSNSYSSPESPFFGQQVPQLNGSGLQNLLRSASERPRDSGAGSPSQLFSAEGGFSMQGISTRQTYAQQQPGLSMQGQSPPRQGSGPFSLQQQGMGQVQYSLPTHSDPHNPGGGGMYGYGSMNEPVMVDYSRLGSYSMQGQPLSSPLKVEDEPDRQPSSSGMHAFPQQMDPGDDLTFLQTLLSGQAPPDTVGPLPSVSSPARAPPATLSAASIPQVPAAAPASGGKKGAKVEDPAKVMMRKIKLQAKNRRAQARLRERRKAEREGYVRQVEELQARLEEVMLEKYGVEAALQQCRQDSQAQPAPPPVREQPLRSKEVGLKTVSEAKLAEMKAAYLSAVRGTKVSSEEARRASVADFARDHQAYKSKVRSLMAEGAGEAGHPSVAAAVKLVGAQRTLALQWAWQEPRAVAQLDAACAAIGHQLAAHHGPPDPQHWHRVLEAMEASDEQRQRLAGLRRDLFSRMQATMAARRQVAELMQAAVRERESNAAAADKAAQAPLGHESPSFLQASQALDRLHGNLEEERQAALRFLLGFYGEGRSAVTPLQEARALVAAHPWQPHKLELCCAAAVEVEGPAAARQPAAISLLVPSGLHSESYEVGALGSAARPRSLSRPAPGSSPGGSHLGSLHSHSDESDGGDGDVDMHLQAFGEF